MASEKASLLGEGVAEATPNRRHNALVLGVATFFVLGVNVLVCGPLPGIISLQSPLTSQGLMAEKCSDVLNVTTNASHPAALPCRAQLEAFERVADLSLSIMNAFAVFGGLLNDILGPTFAVGSLFCYSLLLVLSGIDSAAGVWWQVCTAASGIFFGGPYLAIMSVFIPQWYPDHVNLMNAIATGLWDVGSGFAVLQGMFIDHVNVSVFHFYLGNGLIIALPLAVGWLVIFRPDMRQPTVAQAKAAVLSSKVVLTSYMYVALVSSLIVNLSFAFFYASIFPTLLRWHGEQDETTIKHMTQTFIAMMAFIGAGTSFAIGGVIHRMGSRRGCLLCMLIKPALLVALACTTIFGNVPQQYISITIFVIYRMAVFTVFNTGFVAWFGRFPSVGFCLGLAYGLAGAVSAGIGHVLMQLVQKDHSNFPYVLAGISATAVLSYVLAAHAVYTNVNSEGEVRVGASNEEEPGAIISS